MDLCTEMKEGKVLGDFQNKNIQYSIIITIPNLLVPFITERKVGIITL